MKNPLFSFLFFLSSKLYIYNLENYLIAQLFNFLLIICREDKVVSRMCEDTSNKEAIFAKNWHRFFTKGIWTFSFYRSLFTRARFFNEENIYFRAELEATYAKGLSKLSSKLTKACAKDQGDYRYKFYVVASIALILLIDNNT